MRRLEFFRDCMELWAITVSNQLAGGYKYDEREARYLTIVKKYDADTVSDIARAFGLFQLITAEDKGDVLGECYLGLGLGNDAAGQFFTPTAVSKLMNAMIFAERAPALVESRRKSGEPVRVHDPAVGAGSTLIAGIDLLDEQDVAFRDIIEFDGVDVDPTCVMMAYLQLSVRGVAAIVRHGNSLSLEMWDAWFTPLYAKQHAERALTGASTRTALAEDAAAAPRAIEQLSLLELAS